MVDSTTVNALDAARPRGIKRVLMGVLLAVAGTVAVSAWAQGHGHGGFGGPGMLFSGGPEQVSRAVDHMLSGVNATDAQKAQITQIVQAAATDLKAQRDAGRALHQQGVQLFTATVVDARAVETLRQQMLAQHDQASKRISQAMIDIANVLTPDQRIAIGARMEQQAEKMRARMQQHAASQPKV